MKLRIKGDSLRLRVSPSEMMRLLETGRIEESIHFGLDQAARLTYAVELGAEEAAMNAKYAPGEMTVLVSSRDARAWAAANDVGMYGETETGHGRLQLAVEKDFACLDLSGAANADTFPNPRQAAVCQEGPVPIQSS